MSNVETDGQPTATKVGHGAVGTSPSVGKGARNLDPDLNPWERQPGETKGAYDAFVAFRDSDDRRVGNAVNRKWSSHWSWGHRAFEYDKYIARKEVEDAVRYRRKMNDRQRRTAAMAQSKVIEWLSLLDPAKLTASEAARWLEVAVKVERLAGGAESERVAIGAQGPIENLTAEEVSDALKALTAEINRLT